MAKSLLNIIVIDADQQNSGLLTNGDHFQSPLWVFIGALAKFHAKKTIPIAFSHLSEVFVPSL